MSSSAHAKATDTKCLAIDLGASSGRVVLGSLSNKTWNLAEVGRFRTPAITDSTSGYQCWEMGKMLGQIERHIADARKLGSIASLGVDGWGVDYVLLDEDLHQVGLPVSYRDKRTEPAIELVHKWVTASETYRRTGIQIQPFNTLYQLAASIEQQPDWMRAARHLLMIPDFVHFSLCGVLSNEYTNATTTQMCGLDGNWDGTLMEVIGLRSGMMQTPIAAGTLLGNGNGIASGIQVIAPATHDTASAVAGTPLAGPDEAYISSGTWSLMGIESTTPIASEDALRMNFTNEGGFERRFRILKNIMGMWPLQRVCEERGTSDLAALIGEASRVEPWHSIIDVNDPSFLNPPSMTESIQTFCRHTGQPEPETMAQIARCVFDSLALSYKTVKEQLEMLTGRKLTRIRIVGGGCQNKLLNQLCANACGLPVTAGPVEASALGNLSVQMIALGCIEDLTAARALIASSFEMDEYQPRTKLPAHAVERFNEITATQDTRGVLRS